MTSTLSLDTIKLDYYRQVYDLDKYMTNILNIIIDYKCPEYQKRSVTIDEDRLTHSLDNLNHIKNIYCPNFDIEFKLIKSKKKVPLKILKHMVDQDSFAEYYKYDLTNISCVPWHHGQILHLNISGKYHYACFQQNGDKYKYGNSWYIFEDKSQKLIDVYDEQSRNHKSFFNSVQYTWNHEHAFDRAMYILITSISE